MRILHHIFCAFTPAFLVSAIIASFGCHPPAANTTRPLLASGGFQGVSAPDPPPSGDTTAQPPPRPIPIKANVSYVKATVVLLSLLDSLDYNLSIRINESAPIGGMASLAEPGMTLGLKPRFVLDNDGEVDTTNDRNTRLLSVRSLKTGNDIHAKVSEQGPGIWMLMDVDEQ